MILAGQEPPLKYRGKSGLLLETLLYYRGRWLSMAYLISRLWPDEEPARPNRYLHQVVCRLRHSIGHDLVEEAHGFYRFRGDDPDRRTVGVIVEDLLRAVERLPEPGAAWTGSREYLRALAVELKEKVCNNEV